MSFEKFAKSVHANYEKLAKGELFVTVNGHEVSEAYLAAFPEGTNLIYKTHTEHDCSCCKNFLRNLGNVVGIVDGKLVSIWKDVEADYPYNVVAAALDKLVSSASVANIFRTSEPKYGAQTTKQLLEGGTVKTWNHFYGDVKPKHLTTTPDKSRGDYKTTAHVFARGLGELMPAALQEVLGLIEANSLYRGEEHRQQVLAFKAMQQAYIKLDVDQQEIFAWANAGAPSSRFRNSVIGTLVQDLSEGTPTDRAVASFEAKVAPANYKRPTALITPRMVEDAMKTVTALDLDAALARRFANISDVTVNNVLWADNSAKNQMKSALGSLMTETAMQYVSDKFVATDISIEDFMRDVLPTATSVNMLVKSSHEKNLVSLTAPVHADAGKLFKWDNGFAWSYTGNVTDSIRERVKKAGGSVTGDLCCRLAWNYKDDLDFYMTEPNGHRIYYCNRRQSSPNGGMLDVDANGADGQRDDPAENIVYADSSKMQDGVYSLSVNNYYRRGTADKGFQVEVEFDGKTHSIDYGDSVKQGEMVAVAQVKYTKADGFSLIKSLPTTAASKTFWGVTTEVFTKVETVMLSPNYWDGNNSGNKHYIFSLDGCKADTPARGMYNEFLRSDLEQHRKVFEVLAGRTQCPVADNQISGVGFSSTQGDAVTLRVKSGNSVKAWNVKF